MAVADSKKRAKLWNFTSTYASVVINSVCQLDEVIRYPNIWLEVSL